MQIEFDNANPGQFIFGVVSWPNEPWESRKRRDLYIGFFRWAIKISWGDQ